MKIWIERDGEDRVYMHTKEPEPAPKNTWESKDMNSIDVFRITGEIAQFFRKQLKKDTVAEFELKCIWERT